MNHISKFFARSVRHRRPHRIPYHQHYHHFSANNTGGIQPLLSDEQKEFLSSNGYLWLKEFVPRSVACNIKEHVNDLLERVDPTETKSVFRSHRTEVQHKDMYFLESGDKVRYFWEEHAFDDEGNLVVDPKVAINKIGHALHTLDPIIHSYVWGYLPQLAFEMGFEQPMPVQSMYICKQPGIGGEVSVHQDSTFLLTEPVRSVHGLWLSVDDTSTHNGCIWLVPGSHKSSSVGLRNRFRRRAEDAKQTELVPLIDDGEMSKENGIAIEAKCGDLLVVHGELVHWSDQNRSDQSRHALMIHCVDGKYEWASDNWLQYEKGNDLPRFTQNDVEQQINVRQKVQQERVKS